jgi:LPS-assembly protein
MDITTNVNNIFNNNRLGVKDTLEAGRSLTLGVNYKKESLQDLNKFFEFNIATVLRDKEENFIPNKTTLNKKNSNLFGSISNNFSDYFNLKYNFAVNNNLNTIEYNNLSAEFSFNNFTSKFDFLEERGVMGDNNFIENNTSYSINNQNYITFKTRRNRKLNLTEYYDLVYQYKNDCLSAGIKYKKTYYEDRDLKPSENLFFTISLIPLTNYEQKIER